MDVHIDWLSWTLATKTEPMEVPELYDLAKALLRQGGQEYVDLIYNGTGLERGNPRAPYRFALIREDHGAFVYGHSHTETVLYELSGKGCEALRNEDLSRWVLAGILDRVTRLDIACDVRTNTRPSNFANERHHQRFRSLSYISSDTGETCYIGSPKSDRFCRVYRYNPPHPRSDLLRVEFVFRRSLARTAAEEFCKAKNNHAFAAQLGNSWGFAHKDWDTGVMTDERLRAPIIKREDADTVAWLYKQVLPAMRRLVAAGALDMTDFLNKVYPQEGGQD